MMVVPTWRGAVNTGAAFGAAFVAAFVAVAVAAAVVAAVAEPAGIAERSALSAGGVVSAQARPAVKKRSAPTAGSHIGVLGSGGGGGP